MEKAFFSTPELAEMLGVFHTTIRRWIERDQIKGFRVGRNYKIPAAEVFRMLARHGLPLPQALGSPKEKPKNESPPAPKALQDAVPLGSVLKKLLVVDSIQEPALVGRKGMILGANQAFARVSGLSQIDLIGLSLGRVLEGFSGEAVEVLAAAGLDRNQKEPCRLSARLTTGNGTKRDIVVTVQAVEELEDVFLMVAEQH